MGHARESEGLHGGLEVRKVYLSERTVMLDLEESWTSRACVDEAVDWELLAEY